MNYTALRDIQADLQTGKITLVKLTEYYLHRIEATRDLNIYTEVYAEAALRQAAEADAAFAADPASVGRLHGAVISLKDVLCHAGHRVTGGSKILTGFESLFSATAVQRCLDEGAIVIGRVNCDEFAMGSANENPHYGPTLNPTDPTRVPGGSSGGSAAAVRADTCLVSLGTDTGGSVRQPAAFCGVYGLKPTYGRISRYGLLAYASSFDQLGFLTHSVTDAALFLEITAGVDEFDATCSSLPTERYLPTAEQPTKAKIAYFDSVVNHPSIDPEIRAAFLRTVEEYRTAGHTVEIQNFAYLDYIIPAYYVLTTAEASSNLSRYDGVRYGYRSPDASTTEEVYLKSRTEGFGTEVKRRIMLGTFVLSAGYYDAYYTKAQQVRRLIQQRTFEILEEYDFILLPVAPGPAWKTGEKSNDPTEAYLADIFTVQANMAGVPAMAFPVGTTEGGLPIGLQLTGRRFGEKALLKFVNDRHG